MTFIKERKNYKKVITMFICNYVLTKYPNASQVLFSLTREHTFFKSIDKSSMGQSLNKTQYSVMIYVFS